jgi:peptidoglycan hydrolase CwlO-like protein
MFKKIIFIFSLLFLTFFSSYFIIASQEEDLANKISEYTQKLTELGAAKNTLSNQIKIIDSKVQLTLLKINQTENSIKNLKSEIEGLSLEIGKLDIQLNDLSTIYIHQIIQNYKLQKRIPAFAFVFTSKLNNFLKQYKYLTSFQRNNQENLLKMETVRTNYDLQKTAKEEKQLELEELQKTLASQRASLNSQKASKNKLLSETKNNEKTYQQLLNQAQRQLAALKSFSSSAGGSACLSSSQGGGSDGNFYSQRDSRWCRQNIGYSSDTIGAVGCYISCISMVYKKIGNDISPSAYAANPSNFYLNTAWMSKPNPPAGYVYKETSYNTDTIDNELNQGRYVIAQMSANNSAGMHFIVIKSGSNGNYQIHDPWYGSDLNFSDRYSPALVTSLRLITK